MPLRSVGWTLAGLTTAALVMSLAARRPTHVATVSAQTPSSMLAFTGARLFDGTGRDPLDNATILVRDGRITAAGPASAVDVPAGAERISLSGKTVVPGLINAHGHVNDSSRDLRVYAAHGVTTVYSLGDEPADAFAARRSQNTAALTRSRIFLAGPVLNPASPEEARSLVTRGKQQAVDMIKIRVDDNLGTSATMPRAIYRAVIDESHKQGLRTAVHLFYLADAQDVLDAGADLVAHSIRDRDVDDRLIGQMKARNVCLVPTLMREVSTFTYDSTPAFFSDPQFLGHANPAWVADLRTPASHARFKASASAPRYRTALDVAKRNLKKLFDGGVTIAMGTDTGPVGRFQGYFEWMELDLMVESGLTPKQVLLSATRDAAVCQKIDRELGTLEPNKWADFLVLNGDPLADIRNVRRLDAVYIAGNKLTDIAR